jgi:hypothetical protein
VSLKKNTVTKSTDIGERIVAIPILTVLFALLVIAILIAGIDTKSSGLFKQILIVPTKNKTNHK